MRDLIRAQLSRCGAGPGVIFDCLVAVNEACTNALVHGVATQGGRPPEVSWDIGTEEARFLIRDFRRRSGSGGGPWTQALQASGTADPLPAQRPHGGGGYGVGLMRELMDDVSIEPGAGGTSVSLLKHLR